MVLITQLITEDSGEYRYVVENAPPDTSTDIQLVVQKALTGNWNPKSMTHCHGGSIEINCSFPEPYKHRSKYLCQRHRKLSCFELTSHKTHKMKIQKLPADENEVKFSVTLLQLTERDAGEYWCGAGAAESDRSITLINSTQLFIETQQSGYVGGEVQIICPYYPDDSEKIKLLCKDECNRQHRPLIQSQKKTVAKSRRYSFYENTTAATFTVTITGLKPEDSGKYWCGTNGTSVSIYEYYTELQVTPRPSAMPASSSPPSPVPSPDPSPSQPPSILPQPSPSSSSPRTTTPSTSTSPSTPSTPSSSWTLSSSSTWAVVVVCVVLTAAALLLLIIVCMQRRKRTRECSRTAGGETAGNTQIPLTDRTYEEIKDPRPPQLTEATDTNPNTVYAMAQLPTIPSDDPTYSTVELAPNPSDDGIDSLDKSLTIPSEDGTYSLAGFPTKPTDDGTYSLAKSPTSSSCCMLNYPLTPDDPTYCTAELPTNPCDDGNYSLVQPPHTSQ
ncbi:uncharacterized protein LOC143124751 [Alosa pseudoharengus]|uniref:uncharacterized protein LOC143124751 n=1 Tax=Alosa pseudoharengus TaxID=34774 RepID=UPI003F8AE3CC